MATQGMQYILLLCETIVLMVINNINIINYIVILKYNEEYVRKI